MTETEQKYKFGNQNLSLNSSKFVILLRPL